MSFRSLAAAAALALLSAAPVAAQEAAGRPDIETAAQAYVSKTNADRRDVILAQLRERGFSPEVQAFEGGNDRTGPMAGSNIVLTIGEGAKDIVLTAHYDAVVLRDGSMSQGIVDNAGSVLAMMEAAEALKAAGPTRHRFIIVFTDQEELGLIGARKWLEAHDKARITAVINADVNAYGDTLMYGENVGAHSAFVLEALRGQCVEDDIDCMPYPVYPPSDDRVFSAAGVPVVSIGTQDATGAHQMWLAFNGGQDNGLREGFVPPVFQRIHSTEDKIDYLDGASVARTGGFIADLALRLDRSTAP